MINLCWFDLELMEVLLVFLLRTNNCIGLPMLLMIHNILSVDTMEEDGQHLIYTSWGLLEWSSLGTFVLEDYLEFIRQTIII